MTKNPYLFQSQRLDPETGLYYFKNRYYDPVHGRFISRDPAGMADGPNLYAFVNNNPVNYVDPSGTDGVIVTGPVTPQTDEDGNVIRKTQDVTIYILKYYYADSTVTDSIKQIAALHARNVDEYLNDTFYNPHRKFTTADDVEVTVTFRSVFLIEKPFPAATIAALTAARDAALAAAGKDPAAWQQYLEAKAALEAAEILNTWASNTEVSENKAAGGGFNAGHLPVDQAAASKAGFPFQQVIVHETLHDLGLHDEYVDSLARHIWDSDMAHAPNLPWPYTAKDFSESIMWNYRLDSRFIYMYHFRKILNHVEYQYVGAARDKGIGGLGIHKEYTHYFSNLPTDRYPDEDATKQSHDPLVQKYLGQYITEKIIGAQP